MNEEAGIPVLLTVLTAALLLGGSATTLIGSLGLLRLRSFYERLHAPTLGTTLGMTSIACASMVYFSAFEIHPVLYEVLIIAFVTATTPIALIVLVRAALFRDETEANGKAPPRPRRERP